MDKRDLIILREMQKTDEPFIYRSVLMGTYHGNKSKSAGSVDFFSAIEQDTFMNLYHKHVESILSRPGVIVLIACLKDDPDVILGFSIVDGTTLHFVFVKPAWRKIGLANDLVPKNISTVTGFTRVGDIIRRRKGLVFNPWA